MLKWGTALGLCAAFITWQGSPLVPAVGTVMLAVQVLGFVLVLLVPIADTMRGLPSANKREATIKLAWKYTRISLTYTAVLWLIGHWGDWIYYWALRHPSIAATGGAVIVALWIVVHYGRTKPHLSPALARAILGGSQSRRAEGKLTRQDRRYVAAHEAGHAMVYGALQAIPKDLSLVVNPATGDDGVLGYVSSARSLHQVKAKDFAEWEMMLLLAGAMGEMMLLGQTTLGGTSDRMKWLRLAETYLANQYRGVFYAQPSNELELSQNEKKLVALDSEQTDLLGRFFEANATRHKRLATRLFKKGKLSRDEAFPMLSGVELPEAFPAPRK